LISDSIIIVRFYYFATAVLLFVVITV